MNTNKKWLALALAALLASMAGCPNGQEDELSPAAGSVLIVTTDYQTGAYSVVDAAARTATPNIQAIHADAVCRFDPITGKQFILTRFGGDAVEILDPEAGWAVAKEYSVGAGLDPHDIAVASETQAYITLFASSHLLVVNPTTGEKTGEIDLSSFADADGMPEAESAVFHDGRVYVTLQRLGEKFSPAAQGGLVVIDAATMSVETVLDLAAKNPTGRVRYSDTAKGLVLIESGAYGVLDGGIEYFDTSDQKLSGLIVTEEKLGGDIVDAVLVSPSLGYAVIGTAEGITKLVSFDATVGTKLDELIVSSGWDLYYLELNPTADELWVADRTPDKPGIRIFAATSGEELTDGPIDVGLPPFMMCFGQ